MTCERRAIGGWTVRPIGNLVACPAALRERVFDLGAAGTVHEAMIAAGVLPHPDEVGGEEAQEWIGRTDWCLAAWVRLDRRMLAASRVDLVFDHIDTLGEVRINGVRVALAANEFVPLRVQAKAFLREGVNEIEVRLRGPVSAVEALERRYGSRPVNGDWTPFCFLRKSACNFGWDWGPRVPTVGIGAARIEAWNEARIAQVRPLVVACDEVSATVRVIAEVERLDNEPIDLRVELVAPDGHAQCAVVPIEGERGEIEIAVANPHRWWPRGQGDQPLYALRSIIERRCSPIDDRAQRIGLRTVALDTSPDADGSGSAFTLRVNGRPIWCRGANWIPASLFPRSEPASKITAWIDAACDAELIMLRVWGGGLYESDAFYDHCDERGVLVWQDFMFACATYPEDAPYPALIEAEARHQIARLAAHASVVLWCGGNEDILAWWSWGWRDRLREEQSWGRRYWLELLPALVSELDPTRPYWPESPYSGSMEVHPNEPARGDRHTWDAKLEHYRTIVPRFCSEFGHQSAPSLGTLVEVLGDRTLAIGCEELAVRQRAWGGDAFQYAPLLNEHFPELRTLDEWIFAGQLLQARAYSIAIEWMRANAPRCMGALFWQWNDVWRGHSWSVWDVAGRPKPSFFTVRRACASQCLAVIPRGDALEVVLCTAAGEGGDAPTDVRVRLVRMDGRIERDERVPLVVRDEWSAAASVPRAITEATDPASAVIVVDGMGGGQPMRATHRFVRDRELTMPAGRWRLEEGSDGPVFLADSLLLDVCVLPELAGAMRTRATDGMWTLLPGESQAVRCVGEPVSAEQLRAAVRLANAVGR
jgi:beta-mannosidase